jgi:hypothetical protein
MVVMRDGSRTGARGRVVARVALGAALACASVPAVAQVGDRVAVAPSRRTPSGPEGSVMAVLRRIGETLRSSRYVHYTRVDERAGQYEFDCSGMTAWVLARAAPAAHRALVERIGGARPLARDFYRQIEAVPAGGAARGWARVARVADAQPGDVVAWLRPAVVQSANTGHVGFIVEPPRAIEGAPNAFSVRIADASSYQHEDDSRAGTGRTGFGLGTILVVADPTTGAPVAYGWFGRYSPWILATRMGIGRPIR